MSERYRAVVIGCDPGSLWCWEVREDSPTIMASGSECPDEATARACAEAVIAILCRADSMRAILAPPPPTPRRASDV